MRWDGKFVNFTFFYLTGRDRLGFQNVDDVERCKIYVTAEFLPAHVVKCKMVMIY